jgi:hypothetical protein
MPGYSLAIFQPVPMTTETIASLSLPYRSGSYASGIWKIAQNFTAELMTQQGSVRFDPGYGSRLPDAIRGHNVVAVVEIQAVIAGAIDDVLTNMRRRETPMSIPSEIIESVEIAKIQQDFDRVVVDLAITTLAGSSVVVPLPIELINA